MTVIGRTGEPQRVQLVLICHHPPQVQDHDRPIEFGLQDKRGALAPGEALAEGALRFACDAEAILTGNTLDWRGAYIHGPRGDRFLYFGWREVGGNSWIRRSKVMLLPIRVEQLGAVAHSVRTLIADVLDIGRSRATLDGGWRNA